MESSGTQLDETLRQAREVSGCYEEMVTRMEDNASAWAGIPSIQPVRGVVPTSRFGLRTDPFTGGLAWHEGLDFGAPVGTPVYAPASGLVVRAGWSGNYGQLVEIDHGNGLVTRYGHLSRILVNLGDRVEREDLVGLVGTTGRSNAPHLHYEVHLYGQAVNPEPFILGDLAGASSELALSLDSSPAPSQALIATAGPIQSPVATDGFPGPIVLAGPRPH
jgi:murein DD-endopeptidase MepM/ murein hydrolase activator NlpD